MDGDADLDLFVSNGADVNFLFANQGGDQGGVLGSFVRVLTGAAATDPANSRQAAWGDADGDGDLDLFVPNISGGNYFYVNDGNGGLTRSSDAVVTVAGNSRSSAFADIDRDGDLDLLVSNHSQAKGLFRNDSPVSSDPLQDVGNALAGVKGLPILNANGSLIAGTPIAFQVLNGKNNGQAAFFVGVSAINASFKGGVLVPAPDIVLPIVLNSTGFFVLSATWPAGIPSGFKTWYQTWIADAAGIKGFAATNGIEATTP
jgi:hypothetical protein